MSTARNFYVIGVTGDPETVGIMEQPRERIDIRCLEGAADPDRRSGRIGHDNLAAIIAIELSGDLRPRRLVTLKHPVSPRQGIRTPTRAPLCVLRREASSPADNAHVHPIARYTRRRDVYRYAWVLGAE